MKKIWIENGHLFVYQTNSIEMFVCIRICIYINNANCRFHVLREKMEKESQTKMMPFFMTNEALPNQTQKKKTELKDSVWTTEV